MNKSYKLLSSNSRQYGGTNKLCVIGIAGPSGCGKTFLANKIKEKLLIDKFKQIEILSCDNYYKNVKDLSDGKDASTINWDIPEALDLDLLTIHIEALKKGNKAYIPKYNFKTSTREETTTELDGSKINIIIIEGLFVLFNNKLRDEINLKIFTLLDDDICLARRLQRDVIERGKSHTETIKQYQLFVKPSYIKYIEPTKKFADIIISTSEFTDTSKSIDIISTYLKKCIEFEGGMNSTIENEKRNVEKKSVDNIESKYLKYKNKYLELKN